MNEQEQTQLITALDSFSEAMLIDFADAPDNEDVPIGRLLIEVFRADEREYQYPADLPELYLTVGEIRQRMRKARADLANGRLGEEAE
jgi:hypothetical protein